MNEANSTEKTRFYGFRQRYVAGGFIIDEFVTQYVFIEETSDSAATCRAIDLGVYFNGVDDGLDCPCCGDRWESLGGEQTPQIYGKPIDSKAADEDFEKDVPYCYVYYKNGSKTTYRKQ